VGWPRFKTKEAAQEIAARCHAMERQTLVHWRVVNMEDGSWIAAAYSGYMKKWRNQLKGRCAIQPFCLSRRKLFVRPHTTRRATALRPLVPSKWLPHACPAVLRFR
jgi:hypothetical protein